MRLQRLGYETQDAHIEVPRSSNQSYLVTATGTVPCHHWANPNLIESIDLVSPSDGIYEFTFIAELQCSCGHSNNNLTPIRLQYELEKNHPGLRGVRIRASKNVHVALTGQPKDSARKICISRTLEIEGGPTILCGDNVHTYELLGDLCSSFKHGDRVHIVGTVIEITYSSHGTPLTVNWIRRHPNNIRNLLFLENELIDPVNNSAAYFFGDISTSFPFASEENVITG